jgi:hypothetical protein
MKSVRLGHDLEARLRRAAAVAGVPESDIIREGVAQRCDEVLGDTLADRLKGYIGKYQSPPGTPTVSTRTGAAFKDLLVARRRTRS